MPEIPKELSLHQYCSACYLAKVQPALDNYNEVMSRAKEVLILDRPRRRPLAILNKFEEPLQVEECPDREEAVMRLAFKAAELGCNSVIKVQVSYRKVRNAGYQKMMWRGTGIAANLDGRYLSGSFQLDS